MTTEGQQLAADLDLDAIEARLECPLGHVCANDPLHAQAKIIRQQMTIRDLLALAREAAGLKEALQIILMNAKPLAEGVNPTTSEGDRWTYGLITDVCQVALKGAP